MKKSDVISEIQSNAQENYMDLPVDEKDVIRRFSGTEEARILRKVFPEIVGGLAKLRAPEGLPTRRRGLATR
jgi:phage protein U